MKKIRLYWFVAAAMLAAAGLAGCGDDEEPTIQEEPGLSAVEEYLAEGYVPIDWERVRVESYDSTAGRVVLAVEDGEIPAFQEGSSMVVDQGMETYIRRVKEVKVEGNRVTLETGQGTMADVFRNVKFELSGELSGETVSRGTDGTLRFHPVEIEVVSKDGSKTRWEASRANKPVAGEMAYEAMIDLTGETLFELGKNAKIWWKECYLRANMLPYLYFDFGETEVRDSMGLEKTIKKGVLRNLGCWFEGTVDWAAVPCFSCEGEIDESDSYVYKDLVKEIRIRFAPFGIPLMISIGTDFVVDMSYKMDAALEVYGGVKGSWSRRVGFDFHYEYDTPSMMNIDDMMGQQYETVPLTINAQGEMEAELMAYPRFRVKLYGMVGPTVSLCSSLATECGLGYWEGLGMSYAGLWYTPKLMCSLDYDIFGWKGSLLPMEWALPSLDLYRVPAEVKFVSADKEQVETGETTEVTFQVNARFLGENYTAVGAGYPVHFNTTNVEPSSAVTNNLGQVTVAWTPRSGNEELVAMVYGKEYAVAASDTAEVEVRMTRRISEIRAKTNENNWEIIYVFEYDGEGRVSEITEIERLGFYPYDEETRGYDMLRYPANSLVVYNKNGEVTHTYELENGRAVRMLKEFHNGIHTQTVSEFDYTNGYLTHIADEYREDGEIWYKYEVDYTVENGCYTKGSGSYMERHINGSTETVPAEYKMTASDVENNMTLDLYDFFYCFDENFTYGYLGGIFGLRQKYLLKSIENLHDGVLYERCEYSYQVDENGYITKVEEKMYGGDGGDYGPSTTIWTIIYEN